MGALVCPIRPMHPHPLMYGGGAVAVLKVIPVPYMSVGYKGTET